MFLAENCFAFIIVYIHRNAGLVILGRTRRTCTVHLRVITGIGFRIGICFYVGIVGLGGCCRTGILSNGAAYDIFNAQDIANISRGELPDGSVPLAKVIFMISAFLMV
jgi:hypothetical protein